MPIINGDVSKGTNFAFPPLDQDVGWDAVTLHHYRSYMQANVFTPAGVSGAGFAPLPVGQHALAYPFPPGGANGWNSGDLASMAGGAGWRLSCKELLDVLDHVRRRNTIVSAQKAQYMLDHHLGIDQIITTPAGKIYNKNGSWGKGAKPDTKVEQCVAYFLPGDMEVVAFVNSPIGPNGFSLRGIIKDAFVSALTN
jgi:CubicO group peptidase (beta-lactamase class C family)